MKIAIVPLELRHVLDALDVLRPEIVRGWEALGSDRVSSLMYSLSTSAEMYAGFIDDKLAAIWGLQPKDGYAELWLATTTLVDNHKVVFARYARREQQKILEKYKGLVAYVDSRYISCVDWLRHAGFTIGEPQSYQGSKVPFVRAERRL